MFINQCDMNADSKYLNRTLEDSFKELEQAFGCPKTQVQTNGTNVFDHSTIMNDFFPKAYGAEFSYHSSPTSSKSISNDSSQIFSNHFTQLEDNDTTDITCHSNSMFDYPQGYSNPKGDLSHFNYTYDMNHYKKSGNSIETHELQKPRYFKTDDIFTYSPNHLTKPNCSTIIPTWINIPDGSRFFVIKSINLEHIKKSFYNGIWSSTHFGNKRLSQAFKQLNQNEKIFLFFSANGSGKFCGVAEMISNILSDVDTKDVWENNEKYGKAFKVKWTIVRDIHNKNLKRFLNPLNEMKPVTNSRDTQEIPFPIGHSMMKLFKSDQLEDSSFLDEGYT
ncbi:mRNA-binding phosphate metabolism regulator NDAI_0A04520 [Naumovozyma dairenensis CBS 421]|uniref:YTH domain-containing protein n=1 Tax=Naumovozyma dairenensis (strain ATCC 10597 / BCRC 20456 / CBS 421 / NBRC 0211 / NRRL Y-12639) TaxID=1071378 RepID=G0W470_NAUDC|nr:hypothetical protein NDAI_0A04520 [Naumovozyma dairenensis CBS 421]CCD22608.1 hypothetical protein NDAI_0A04520 [Naumovozyma dairenensis CBS 421]